VNDRVIHPFLVNSVPPVQRYLLACHVFACMAGEQVVLLDLRRDQYLALDSESSRHLREAIIDWPVAPSERLDSQQAIDATLEELRQRDLITLDTVKGKSATPVTAPPPTQTLLPPPEIFADAGSTSRSAQFPRVAAVLIAAGTASLWLRLRGIEWIVHTLSRRVDQTPLNEDLTKELVAQFYDSRPFLFSARNACLFDSLALMLLLRRFRVCPRWIFGIRTGPFAAHCWLQHGNIVLNDTVENVRSYTPIMLV
jgi:hypothetical protein